MSLTTIMSNIKSKEATISAERSRLSQYEAMNAKLNKAIDYLLKSKNDSASVFLELKRCYSSDGIPRDDGRVADIENKIETQITNLRQALAESNAEILRIKSKIDVINGEISNLWVSYRAEERALARAAKKQGIEEY